MNFLWKAKTTAVSESGSLSHRHNASGFFSEDDILKSQQTSKPKNGPYNLKEFPRILEKNFGECLGNRTKILSSWASDEKLGLGPPDMIHFTLFDKFHQEEIGEYFYITGVDLSSESMPIALLNMLKVHMEPSQRSTDGKIATYCCLNIFRQLDIRIRFESDKNYQVSALDCRPGKSKVQLSNEIWEETFVSSCLRSLIFNIDPVRKLAGLVEYPLAISNGEISNCKRMIRALCKFVPRVLECGWDSSRSVQATLIHNYLTEALLIFLSIAPGLVDYAISTLRGFAEEDPDHGLYYSIVMIAIMDQEAEKDVEMIGLINNLLDPLMSRLDEARPRDPDSLQLVNCISDLLNLQAKFLIRNEDYDLALSVAKMSTELASDSFDSWFFLAKCYMQLGYYDNALISINCMPHLPDWDKCTQAAVQCTSLFDYYKRPLGDAVPRCGLTSIELNNLNSSMKNLKDHELKQLIYGRIVMPVETKRGCIKEIWENACASLGPIYGPHSKNLVNFVSPQEVQSMTDLKLLARNTISKQINWFHERVYELLVQITSTIGWNGLLHLRSKIFIMEKEYIGDSQLDIRANERMPRGLKEKRLCERWLDQLFLDLYEDLRISSSSQEHRGVKYNGLEWELLGLILLRTWKWQDAVACLRTSIMARFDIVSCKKLLELFMRADSHHTNVLDIDVVLELLVQKISYEARFYDGFQVANLQVLYKISQSLDIEVIRNRVTALPFAERGIVVMVETFLEWIKEMTVQKSSTAVPASM
ncbi:hypothetical protein HG535_0H01010 [Zygotorulaspora mrakii]|uniref:Uncharacterized protein n=1 Tax=Zygotorulaspora mrakii TaxID=42260 RepID=A0A7H9B7X6_ZYGMR|nr:uncharacterized protein HG535_0H01010 [Zygotorulaspora mrakii]QLG74775.1 hypothetical protein HG535_0H01010 [Zygotorulaspora mrakii]